MTFHVVLTLHLAHFICEIIQRYASCAAILPKKYREIGFFFAPYRSSKPGEIQQSCCGKLIIQITYAGQNETQGLSELL